MQLVTVTAVKQENYDTVTLRLATDLAFTPGQFVMLGATVGARVVRRSYSISSAPNGVYIEVTIKKEGVFSTYCHGLEPGAQLQLYGPFGKHFTLAHMRPSTAVVFIAGGTGIAPFRSMIQSGAAPAAVFYGLRAERDILFREELAVLQPVIALSRPDTPWEGPMGRINAKLIEQHAPADAVFYVCGSASFLSGIRQALQELQIPLERITTENFGQVEG